jgi:3-hydroxyacyl-[acyl-carrier-protein] dehydratase
MADEPTVRRILDLVPQKDPFRFIDDIISIDDDHAVAARRFTGDESFYAGHFPGNPVTPGVILIETMAQCGLVTLAIHNYISKGLSDEEIRKTVTLFALLDGVEFSQPVRPGDRVIVMSDKIYFKKGNLKTSVSMTLENGDPVCRGILTGKGVIQ